MAYSIMFYITTQNNIKDKIVIPVEEDSPKKGVNIEVPQDRCQGGGCSGVGPVSHRWRGRARP
jgi:hypothetical protein